MATKKSAAPKSPHQAETTRPSPHSDLTGTRGTERPSSVVIKRTKNGAPECRVAKSPSKPKAPASTPAKRASKPSKTKVSWVDELSDSGTELLGHCEATPEEQREAATRDRKAPTDAKGLALAAKLAGKKPSKQKGKPLAAEVVELQEHERSAMVAIGPKGTGGSESVEHVEAEPVEGPGSTRKGTYVRMTEAMFEELCIAVANGHAIHNLCSRPGYPTRETFFKWCRDDANKAKRYAEALSLRGEKFADEIVSLADEAMYAASPEEAQAYRLRVDARKWVAARLLPKKYGDRVTVQGDEENPLVTALVLGGDALAAKIRGGGAK